MKNVRIIYKKKSLLKFVSHLDMNRFMTRVLRRTNIPFWYTEGFNTHLYINFALPLSLGFESDYEIMDLKITDDAYSFDEAKRELNRVMPEYIEVVSVVSPWMKNAELAFAEFKVLFDDGDFAKALEEFLSENEILTQKKSKKGTFKTINLAEKIKDFSVKVQDGKTELRIILPAGSSENINPVLLLDAFWEANGYLPEYDITRLAVFNNNLELFV